MQSSKLAKKPEAPNATIFGGILIVTGAIVWCFSPPAGTYMIQFGLASIASGEGERIVELIKKKN